MPENGLYPSQNSSSAYATTTIFIIAIRIAIPRLRFVWTYQGIQKLPCES